MASPETVPRAACSLLIRPPKSNDPLDSSLPESEPPVPSCAGSPLPAADAVTAAARPPARPSRQLPPRDVPRGVCAGVSKRISSPPSFGAREGPGPRRPAAEWLPVHTLGALSPPTPPLLRLVLSLRSQLLLPLPLPGSQRRGRNLQVQGREGWGKKRRCLPGRGGSAHPSGALQGVGRVLGRERGGEGVPGGGGPAGTEPHASYPGAGAAGQMHGVCVWGGGALQPHPQVD